MHEERHYHALASQQALQLLKFRVHQCVRVRRGNQKFLPDCGLLSSITTSHRSSAIAVTSSLYHASAAARGKARSKLSLDTAVYAYLR